MTAKDKNAAHARFAVNVRHMYEQIGRAYVSGDTMAISYYETLFPTLSVDYLFASEPMAVV